jgi:hypothetical protein
VSEWIIVLIVDDHPLCAKGLGDLQGNNADAARGADDHDPVPIIRPAARMRTRTSPLPRVQAAKTHACAGAIPRALWGGAPSGRPGAEVHGIR